MKCLRLISTILFVGMVGCSLPMTGGRSSAVTPAVPAVETDVDGLAPPIVQVRDYWRSAIVSVVAWDADDATFGLRASVSRSGKLVGGVRFGDHRLYLTPILAHYMGGFAHAAVMPDHLLLAAGTQRDSYACFYGRNCSPMVTLGVSVPDSLLRANRDSLVVTFFPRVMEPWTLTLRRGLIAAYLAKVDSVVAEMSKPTTM
jgi:hypothetical protein